MYMALQACTREMYILVPAELRLPLPPHSEHRVQYGMLKAYYFDIARLKEIIGKCKWSRLIDIPLHAFKHCSHSEI